MLLRSPTNFASCTSRFGSVSCGRRLLQWSVRKARGWPRNTAFVLLAEQPEYGLLAGLGNRQSDDPELLARLEGEQISRFLIQICIYQLSGTGFEFSDEIIGEGQAQREQVRACPQ